MKFRLLPSLLTNTTRILLLIVAVMAPLIVMGSTAHAQTGPTDGMTPSGLSPGAAAGSYGLSGFDNVNLYNGNLDVALPLLGIGGRGGAQTQMTLKLETTHWIIERDNSDGFEYYYPNPNSWEGIKPGYGPGVLQARVGMVYMVQSHLTQRLTRLTFTAGDGTEYELIDTYHGGAPWSTGTHPRGRVFVSHDGAFLTFVSNTDIFDVSAQVYSDGISGYLYFPDGTRYEISDGKVTKIRDRNGNLISFAYDSFKRVTTVTDSLNRQITISYANMSSVFYDQISYKGFGGAQRTIKVWHTSLSNALRSGYSIQTYSQLFGSGDSTTHNPSDVVSALELPDGRQYQFRYNPYGELARVVLPTGGAIEYDYVEKGDGTTVTQRRASERRVYPDGSTLESKQVYTASYSGTTTTTVEQKDANNNLLSKSLHYFYSDPISSINNAYNSAVTYSNWQEGREFKTESLAADGSTVLRRAENTWEQGTTVTSWLASVSAANNPRVNQTVTTLVDTNQVAQQTFSFDQYNNTTDVYEYDFGSGAAGNLVRRTHTDFMTTNPVNSIDYTSSANSLYLYRLPSQTSVFDAGGIERARTSFEYDNYATVTNHAGLVNRSDISGFDSGFNTGYLTRANVTATTRYLLNTSGQVTGSISTYAQFDIAGNTVEAIDGRGYETLFYFDDSFGAPNGNAQINSAPTELSGVSQSSYALLTKVTNHMNQSAFAQYDYYLGHAVDGEDMNGVVSSGYFDDALDRPTKVIRDYNNLAATSKIEFSYDDTNHIVTTKGDFATYDDKLLRKDSLYDGLGRTTETRAYENSTQYITAKTVPFTVLQDPDTSAWIVASQASNPYRAYLSESAVWTTSYTDALGRTTKVKTPDNAIARRSYSGNSVTVTDQAGKSRKSVSDALGRLTSVYEDPSGLNYQTSYSYDVMDDLTAVSQGAQTRSFAYDSLKRLTSAYNPESGTTSYTYDNNGNILTKTDARSIVTTIAYDALNRPSSKTYTNDGGLTSAVAYFYDAQSLPGGAPSFSRGYSTGRLVAVTYGGGSAGNYLGYDALGRTSRKIQQTDSVNYLTEGSYNVSGAMTSEVYPSVPGAGDRRTISYSFDTAGRLSSLASSATSYAPGASVSSIAYASHGAVASETYGNSLSHAAIYNNRLQTTEIKLGTSSNPTSVIDLTYNYGTTGNNGNVQSAGYSGGGLSYTQAFTYDALNRLSNAQENSGSSWSQTNGYDRYGNRWIDLGGGNQSLYFNTTTNRITSGGFGYDLSGNLTNDTVHSYAYDAEGHIKTVDSTTAYVYDGDGERVRKLVGENIRFVYGLGDELIMEFDGSSGTLKKEYVSGGLAAIEPTALNSNGTRYQTVDSLGSPRVITNSSGGVVSRHDFMPFGEELSSGVGGRTSAMGFGIADGGRDKFTGYEADSETGLNFADARYQSATQGRFTSPDPLASSATAADPQSFNRYAYVGNNPLNAVDPSGLLELTNNPGAGSMPGAIGALGRVHPGDCPPTEWSENLGYWLSLHGSQSQTQAAQQQQTAVKKQLDELRKAATPLPEGVQPVPTTIVYLEGEQKTYNGEQVMNPDGTPNTGPVYGTARVNAVAVLDQGGNIIKGGLELQEKITAISPDAKAAEAGKDLRTSNNHRIEQSKDGLFFDRVGVLDGTASARDARNSQPYDVQVNQRLYVAPAGGRTPILYMINTHRTTNRGITSTIGKSLAWPRS